MSDAQWEEQWAERDRTLSRIELSVLYHRRRERWFASRDRFVKAIAIIGGSVAFARVTDDAVVQAAGAAIAIASTITLVFAFADRARLHSDLAARFSRLEADIHGEGLSFVGADLARWRAQLAEIEALEPPALATLVRMCQNQQALARNQPHHVYRVRWYERLFANLFDFPAMRLEPVE